MFKRFVPVLAVAAAGLLLAGCGTAPKGEAKRDVLHDDAQASLKAMRADDPSLNNVLDRSYGYVIFPSVGKGGFIVGGSWGRGEVYEQGKLIGYADIKSASVGLQAGGQEFSELIVFQDKDTLDRFINNKVTLAADASAVAIKAGVGGEVQFRNGMAVFVKPKGGLMAGVSVAGQNFGFTPLRHVE